MTETTAAAKYVVRRQAINPKTDEDAVMAADSLGSFPTFQEAREALAAYMVEQYAKYGKKYGSDEYVQVLSQMLTNPSLPGDDDTNQVAYPFGGAQWVIRWITTG